MKRRIIRIDEEKCNGCGACAAACHEGAIEMIDGKAKLTREDYCDGLGDCLPQCPTDAISFEEREAPAYDEAAVLAARRQKQAAHSGCPGTQARMLHREDMPTQNSAHGCPGSQARDPARRSFSRKHCIFRCAHLRDGFLCTEHRAWLPRFSSTHDPARRSFSRKCCIFRRATS